MVIKLQLARGQRSKADDLEPAAAKLRQIAPDCTVRVSHYETKAFDPAAAVEVVRAWLTDNPGVSFGVTAASTALIEQVVGTLVDWTRRRFSGTPEEGQPKIVTLYGPDGAVLKAVEVKKAPGDEALVAELVAGERQAGVHEGHVLQVDVAGERPAGVRAVAGVLGDHGLPPVQLGEDAPPPGPSSADAHR